jgi:hypothetical protein
VSNNKQVASHHKTKQHRFIFEFYVFEVRKSAKLKKLETLEKRDVVSFANRTNHETREHVKCIFLPNYQRALHHRGTTPIPHTTTTMAFRNSISSIVFS